MSESSTLVAIRGLTKEYRSRNLLPWEAPNVLRAADDVSFDIQRGEAFGLVGESGCGKSTIARCIVALQRYESGSVTFDGTEVAGLSRQELQRLRRRMQIVFQDPYSSLDPRMTIQEIVEEGLEIHELGDERARTEKACEILKLVGIRSDQFSRRPHALSGGQRQRVAIARALVLDPELVVLDEAVSALDVSIQAQVLNLLTDLQERLNLTYLFIVHDLALAEYFCHRIAVLYRGAIVELAPSDELFEVPLHPYSVALLAAAPGGAPDSARDRVILKGEVSAVAPSEVGCRFRSRCPVGRNREECRHDAPALRAAKPGHLVACHFPGELAHHAEPATAADLPVAVSRLSTRGDHD
jgi:oligopeptide/dipeptide ABC transporter ATP-binding protein